MSTMCFFHEPLELKKFSKEHLPINHLVPSPFLCVHAIDREKKGLVNVYASVRILEFFISSDCGKRLCKFM